MMPTSEDIRSALWGFRTFLSALIRGIDDGALTAVPKDNPHGLSISVDGTRYALVERVLGAMDARALTEPAQIIKELTTEAKSLQASQKLLALTEALAAENAELRQLLGPVEKSLLTVTRDKETQELVSSVTLKRRIV